MKERENKNKKKVLAAYKAILQRFAYSLAITDDLKNPDQYLCIESCSELEQFLLNRRKILGDRRFYYAVGFFDATTRRDLIDRRKYFEDMQEAFKMFEAFTVSEN